MKRMVLLVNVLWISLSVFAWQAPKEVTDAFHQRFNGASNVKWEKENEHDYRASFDMLGKKVTAVYNAQGQWLATHTDVGMKGLPGISRIVLQTRFIGWNISTAHKIEKADGTILFRADLDRRGSRKQVFLNNKGAIMK